MEEIEIISPNEESIEFLKQCLKQYEIMFTNIAKSLGIKPGKYNPTNLSSAIHQEVQELKFSYYSNR